MAKFGYTLSGGAPVIRRYKLGATAATKGVFMLAQATTVAGLAPATATAAAKVVGLSVDAGTYTTTQSTTMAEGLVTVVINPDLVSKWRMSGTTASGGSLAITTNSSANSAGVTHTITTGDAVPNSPTMLDGTIIYIAGNNVGLPNSNLAPNATAYSSGSRAITTVSATVATVLVPFPYTIASGDVAILVPWANTPSQVGKAVTFTTSLDEVRQNTTATGAATRVVELMFDTPAGTGTNSPVRTNSYVLLVSDDHILNVTT